MSDNCKFTRRSVLGAAGLTIASGLAVPVAADHDVGTGDQYPETCDGPGYNDTPRLPNSPWQVHDPCRPQPPVVDPGEPEFSESPADATVLIGDGSDSEITLDAWEQPDGSEPGWDTTDSYAEVNGGSIQTTSDIGNAHYHVEWRAPSDVEGSSQHPGNSGVFLANRYEIQILNNYENPTYADGYAAAVYGQHPPLVNASRPPGEWQSYDIIWHAPRFTDDGDLDSPGVVTIYWNGVLVQSQTTLTGPTRHRDVADYSQHSPAAPLRLQDHGQSVRYRNVWYRSLPAPSSVVTFDDDQLTAENTASTLEASLTNPYDSAITHGEVTLTASSDSGVEVTPHGTSFHPLTPGDSQSVSWEVIRPSAESGPHLLSISASHMIKGEQQTIDFRIPIYPEPSP